MKNAFAIGLVVISVGCFKIPTNKNTIGTDQVVATKPTTSKEDSIPPAVVKEEWFDASNVLTQGDIQLRITKVSIDNVDIDSFSKSRSKDKLLIVSFEVTNLSDKKIMDYKGLATKAYTSFRESVATLKDDNDNNYKRIYFGLGSRVEGQVHSNQSIYPKKSLSDLLVFEPPVDVAKFVLLEIPADSFGGQGVFRIKINQNMWK